MVPYSSRVAVVTGAARGIGFGIARRLLAEGARIVACDVDGAALQHGVTLLGATSDRILAVKCDVSRAHDVRRMIQSAEQTFGYVSILVNNAGISPKHLGVKATVADMDEAEWRRVLDINLTGAFLCSRACLPSMKSNQWGRIINIASLAGRTRSDIAGAHYAASKAGMMALARTLAAEVGIEGITVNSIAPGRIDTPMAEMAGTTFNTEYIRRIPVGRIGTPDDIAAAVAYFASEDASFVNGVTLDVNGGTFMV